MNRKVSPILPDSATHPLFAYSPFNDIIALNRNSGMRVNEVWQAIEPKLRTTVPRTGNSGSRYYESPARDLALISDATDYPPPNSPMNQAVGDPFMVESEREDLRVPHG